jgi:hypothetical protein
MYKLVKNLHANLREKQTKFFKDMLNEIVSDPRDLRAIANRCSYKYI